MYAQCIMYPFINYKWLGEKLEMALDFKKYFLLLITPFYATEEIIRFYQKMILNSNI